MTSPTPVNEILDLRIQISSGFYPVLLNEEVGSAEWARDVVALVASETSAVDHEDSLVTELEDLRIRLLSQLNPYLTAAVSVRPEKIMSLGALLTFEIVDTEPGQGPDWYEEHAKTLVAQPSPEAFTISMNTWRAEITAGDLVGVHQVVEYRQQDDDAGWVEARTVFGVFPPHAAEMVQFTFTTADLNTFGDMRVETQAIVASLELELGQVA